MVMKNVFRKGVLKMITRNICKILFLFVGRFINNKKPSVYLPKNNPTFSSFYRISLKNIALQLYKQMKSIIKKLRI